MTDTSASAAPDRMDRNLNPAPSTIPHGHPASPSSTTNSSTPAGALTLAPSTVPPPASPDSAYTSYIRHFLSTHPTIITPADLQRAVAAETESQLEALRARMREREEALRRNADVEKQIAELVQERELERKVVENWRRRKGRSEKGMGPGDGREGEGLRAEGAVAAVG